MKKLIYITFILLITISCSNNKKTVSNTELETIDYSDLPNNKKTELPANFNYKFVPLETNDSCLIGDMNKILYINKRIYILDFTETKSIYVFNLDGKFLFKIAPEGGSDKECGELTDFEIHNNNIVVLSSFDQKVLFYDLNGNYIKTLKLEDYGNVSLKFLSDSLFITSACDYGNRVVDYWNLKGKKIKSIKVKYLPEETTHRPRRPLTVNKNNIYINFGFSDTIFEVTKDKFKPSIVYNFGSKHLPVEEIKTNKKLLNSYYHGKYNVVYNYSITDNFIYTDILRKGDLCATIYNRKTRTFKEAKSFTINNYTLTIALGDLKDGFIFALFPKEIKSVNKKRHSGMFKNIKISDNPVIVLVTEKDKTHN